MQDFGPLAPFMADSNVKEIIVENGRTTVVNRNSAEDAGVPWPDGPALFRFAEDLVNRSGWHLPFEYDDVKDGKVIRQQLTMVSCNVDGGLLFAVKPPTAPYKLHIWKDRRWPTFDVDAMATATD